MLINSILILTETTFRERDFARFGVETLRKHFDVHILDCTSWLHPVFWEQNASLCYACAGHQAIHSLAEFHQAISSFGKQTVAFEYLLSCAPRQQLRLALRRAGIQRAVVFSSQLPDIRRSSMGALRDLLRKSSDMVQRLYAHARCQLHPQFSLPEWIADIAIVSGLNNLKSVKAQYPRLIHAHAFDYDTYLTTQPSPLPTAAYAVFLDQNLAYHTDVLVTGRQHPASASAYFPALNRFLTALSKKLACRSSSPRTLGGTTIIPNNCSITARSYLARPPNWCKAQASYLRIIRRPSPSPSCGETT